MEVQRLKELLRLYQSGNISGPEEKELHLLLENYWDTVTAKKEPDHINWEAMFREITGAGLVPGQMPVIKPIHKVKRLWWAAAAILLIAAGTWWSTYKKTTIPGPSITYADIKPGVDKATLTLGDGTTVVLDSISRPIADVNGVTIMNFNKGELAYKPDAGINSKDISYNVLSTPKGGQYKLVLPDGSRVWLNAASSIRFPSAFVGNDRRVEITGEVYIEVVPNTRQPFFAESGDAVVQVLGTGFNMNCYEDEPFAQITLVEGSTRITSKKVFAGQANSVLLHPGQQATLNNDRIVIKSADIEQVTAWKNGLFNFNGLTLQEMLRSIARWYDVEIICDPKLSGEKFGGAIQRDLNLSEILAVLKQAGVHFRIEGRRLIVMP